MECARTGESGTIPDRSDRFFQDQGQNWYFATREGAPIGPFTTRSEAENGLRDFIDFVTLADPATLLHLRETLTGSANDASVV